MANEHAMERFRQKQEEMLAGGGPDKIEEQHGKGKLSVRERISAFLDEGSVIEHQLYTTSRSTDFGMDKKRFLGDGVVTGTGTVYGRQVFFAAQDFTILGGSLGEMHAQRIAEAQHLAFKNRKPFIQINDSGGARIQEGVLSLDGYAKIFRSNTLCSGVIPQFSVILGPCAGGAVYSPAITDFILMVDGVSNMYITGPDVIRAVTGEDISHEELGGAYAHCGISGNAHFRFSSEQECIDFLKVLLSYLPSNNQEKPPVSECDDPVDRPTPRLADIMPEDPRQPYDVREFINEICDQGSFLEVQAEYAPSAVVGFGKLAGYTVGFFANQPLYYAGTLDINSSDKAARFLRFCDCFNIPIITLVDVPGFLPGTAQEHGGIIRHGAKVLYAIAEATVPKIAVIIRKAYGGAYIAMSSKALGYDRTIALPTAEIGVMGPDGAANIIFRKEIKEAANPDEMRQLKINEFKEKVMNPYVSASYGVVDDVVDPASLRYEVYRSLMMNIDKKEERPDKKHGNIPL